MSSAAGMTCPGVAQPGRLRVAVSAQVLILLLLSVTPAVAADALAPQAAVETRRAGFKKMGAAMRIINDQFKAATPEAARLAASAQDIAALAPQVAGWFPAGSDAASGFETDALDYIWKERAKFDQLAGQLAKDSQALAAAAAAGDLAVLRAQVRTVGAVCGTCHRSFRAD